MRSFHFYRLRYLRHGGLASPAAIVLGVLMLTLVMAGRAAAGSGVLTQLAGTDGCVSETGTGGDCADGKALDGPRSVAVSPDGKHVYVASITSDAVAVFSRD